MYLSLIVPAYNEELRIGATLSRVLEYLDRLCGGAEVIVVDDGSLDGTSRVVDAYLDHQPTQVRLLAYPDNKGKGNAVRMGMMAAQGERRVFYDADGSTPIEELGKLLQHFDDGADVVIGSRSIPGAEVRVRQAWYREQMGKTFNLLLRSLGLTRFRDTQCGFKGFTAGACEIVFPRQTILRYSFDAELLYIARVHGLRIDEVPVQWINSPLSRVHPLSDASRMFWDLLRIRVLSLMGRYA